MRLSGSTAATAMAIAFSILVSTMPAFAAPAIYVNQVAYDARGPKIAVVQSDAELAGGATFTLIDDANAAVEATNPLGKSYTLAEWANGKFFYRADFSSFQKSGTYKISASINGTLVTSPAFKIDD